MSYFEDYIEDGLCCEYCGAFMDGTAPGFIRRCAGCQRPEPKAKERKRARSTQPGDRLGMSPKTRP